MTNANMKPKDKQNNDLAELWSKVLGELKPSVSSGNFGMLLKPTRLISIEDDIATIAAPSSMVIDLLQKRFTGKIGELLKKNTGHDIDIILVPRSIPDEPKKEIKDAPLFEQDAKPETKLKPLVGHLPRVRPDYTFNNFAVSSTNQLAFVSAQRVAQNIGRSYNPLFIYGPVGVGKTHLMHAVANEVYAQSPERKILYITSEEFTNEVIEAIRNNDTAKMKRRFRSAYLLLIDDIQFIEGKERVQEELFHTFNILIDQGSQICLSSDRPPKDIKKLEKRLSSRFAGGLTVDISEPDFELKAAILGIKARRLGLELPDDVINYLAEQAEDTRSLEGLLMRVFTQASASNMPVTIDLAKSSLGAVQDEKRGRVHIEDVINGVCEFYKVKPTQLKGPKRDASLVRARQVCMYLLYEDLGTTYVEIGNILGGRDHTTIMHGVDKIRNLVENKSVVHEDIAGIKRVYLS